jgi:Raf kinase inhibitor-like YbhB/YbcL family protein
MRMRILLVTIPLLIVGGLVILIWRMHAGQQAEARYHSSLVRSLQVSSDAFEDQGGIPSEFSCEGEGISPPLKWADLPQGTQSLVLLVTDEDLPSPSFSLFKIVHWVLYNIPSDATGLDAGVTGAELSELGIRAGLNWSREARYYPPCPVSGRHRYVFRLYALDIDAIQPEEDNRSGVLKAMENHIIAYGKLNGFYEK